MKKENVNKKSQTPTEAEYFSLIDDLGENQIVKQYKYLGTKKVSFSMADSLILKKKCFDLYKKGRTFGEASASTGVPRGTVYGWFKEFEINYPL